MSHIEQQCNALWEKYHIETDDTFTECIERTIDGWRVRCEQAERELQNSQNKLKASGRAKLREEVARLRAENEELSTRYAFMCDAIKCAHETLNDGFMGTAMAILDAALAAKE